MAEYNVKDELLTMSKQQYAGKMAPNIENIKSQAGYPGHDAMRERAMKEFGGELTRLKMGQMRPAPFNSKDQTKMRKY